MAERSEQGTGKHPHKDSKEPWPHTQERRSESRSSEGEHTRKQSASERDRGSSSDLKEREYRDEEGNVHHHTRTSEAMKDRKAS
jgi:hypothetical protein